MPIAGFICPDNQQVYTHECFKQCRIADSFETKRCKALPFLKKISKSRPWTGYPSTTQLINGTREEFLKIKIDYFINPDKKVTAVIGTNAHYMMYKVAESPFKEEKLLSEILSGTYDMYDPDTQTLYDYKTWGVWKVKKILEGTLDEMVDSLFEISIQMNQYRILLKEKYPELPVNNLSVQILSRESGLKYGKKAWNCPLLTIPYVEDKYITEYTNIKAERLHMALKTGWAPQCREKEHWGFKKCQEYCDVRENCIAMENNYKSPQWEEYEESLKIAEENILEQIKQYILKQKKGAI